MLTIRRCEFVKPVILVATVTYFVVAVSIKQIDSLYDSFIVNTTRGDARALCRLASVKTRQIHHSGILGDNTETWIAQSDNFELNNVTFCH